MITVRRMAEVVSALALTAFLTLFLLLSLAGAGAGLAAFLSLPIALGGTAYAAWRCVQQVPPGHVGLVRKKFGRVRPGDESRQVRAHGSIGHQAETLGSDQRHLLPPFLYQVTPVPWTRVPTGTIGVVVARDGLPAPVTRTLCAHVDCDDFQDGTRFLRDGGQKGRQPGVLRGGADYAVNPLLFEVLTVDTIGHGRYGLTAADLMETEIPVGTVGVVIAREGRRPGEDEVVGHPVDGHESFQLPDVFIGNGGLHGVQEETLSQGGVYRINPWFAQVVLIPTHILVLEWTRRTGKPDTNYDKTLEQIRINVEGHWLRFTMSQTIEIPAKAAPRLVGRFGHRSSSGGDDDTEPVRRFVDKVLGRTVEGYFQTETGGYRIEDFLDNSGRVRLELEELVCEALDAWGVKAVRTTLNEFEPEETGIDELRRAIAAERNRQAKLHHELGSAGIQHDIDLTRIETQRMRDKAGVAELEEQLRLLGRDAIVLERFLDRLKDMNVPAYVGGDAAGLLQHMPLHIAQSLISEVMENITQTTAPFRRPHLGTAQPSALFPEDHPQITVEQTDQKAS
ncbi:SPFH domain-containing protein [Sphaerisporangium corydalis]|uniref:SPFH domain-containing protein n=1 Tax=Sphaerisporangium corydalis TaxID=1441875 RepID=A0ABV9ECR1_9ACTN|nr:SPFH domain-containing protein [Sphaerisporangium corydalis]